MDSERAISQSGLVPRPVVPRPGTAPRKSKCLKYVQKNSRKCLGISDLPSQLHISRNSTYLYNSGARASEAAGTSVSDLRLDGAPSVLIQGKGRKDRVCPLWPRTAETLRGLLGARLAGPAEAPVFLNCRGQRITRHGVHTLVERSVAKAISVAPSLAGKRVSPHTVRHSTAVHLLRAGVDINTIRAWLGHVSLETTNRYAEVDLEMKARALATCADNVPAPSQGNSQSWHRDSELMEFLTSL